MGLVAVLPIFRTSIYQSCVSGQSFSKSPKKDAQKLICGAPSKGRQLWG